MQSVKDLSLLELIALHNNWFMSNGKGARFQLLSNAQFIAIEKELEKRIQNIKP